MPTLPPSLIDKHKGQVVIILGNGPSIGDYDLHDPFFTENITIGSNAIGKVFQPTYYVISDPGAYRVFGKLMFNNHSIPLVGCHISMHSVRSYHRFYYKTSDFYGPLTRGRLYHGRTSGVLMINIAYQMGFTHFFLLGIDGYGIQGQPHFYKNSAGRSSSDLLVAKNLMLAAQVLQDEGKFIWNLSRRSVYHHIPVWPELPAVEADQRPQSLTRKRKRIRHG